MGGLFLVLALQAADGSVASPACAAGANCSSGQYGGTSIGTLNVGRPAFKMTDALMAEVARQLGAPRDLMVNWVGGMRSKAAAEQLEAYLIAKGFHITDGVGIGMLVPPLEQPVELRPDGLYIDASK